ncbi:MAG TPA: hypothetical protein VHM19_14580 [Polyangiales bacterium]|nr:hypothetical protein [Polyangiales bacterium]
MSGAAIARAQPTAAAAETLFRAGREAMARGDARTACAKFRESYRLDSALGTLLNISVCEEQLGELSNAWQHYQEVVHSLPESDSRVTIARQHLDVLEPRLPRLTLKLAESAPPETRITIGTIELAAASLDVAFPVDPGSYEIVVTAGGYEPRFYHVDLAEKDRVELAIEPGPPLKVPLDAKHAAAVGPMSPSAAPAGAATDGGAQPSAAAPRVLRVGRSPRRSAAYVLFGVSGAMLITGAVTGVLALGRASVVNDECEGSKCSTRGLRAASAGKALFTMSMVGLGTALATGGTGLYLWLSEPKPGKPPAAAMLVARTQF